MSRQHATDIAGLVERFLTWPVPPSVCPDGVPGKPGRTGTNLLSATEAREMLMFVLGGMVAADAREEAEFRLGYRMGLSRGGNDETEDDVVRLWKHKRSVEAETGAIGSPSPYDASHDNRRARRR